MLWLKRIFYRIFYKSALVAELKTAIVLTSCADQFKEIIPSNNNKCINHSKLPAQILYQVYQSDSFQQLVLATQYTNATSWQTVINKLITPLGKKLTTTLSDLVVIIPAADVRSKRFKKINLHLRRCIALAKLLNQNFGLLLQVKIIISGLEVLEYGSDFAAKLATNTAAISNGKSLVEPAVNMNFAADIYQFEQHLRSQCYANLFTTDDTDANNKLIKFFDALHILNTDAIDNLNTLNLKDCVSNNFSIHYCFDSVQKNISKRNNDWSLQTCISQINSNNIAANNICPEYIRKQNLIRQVYITGLCLLSLFMLILVLHDFKTTSALKVTYEQLHRQIANQSHHGLNNKELAQILRQYNQAEQRCSKLVISTPRLVGLQQSSDAIAAQLNTLIAEQLMPEFYAALSVRANDFVAKLNKDHFAEYDVLYQGLVLYNSMVNVATKQTQLPLINNKYQEVLVNFYINNNTQNLTQQLDPELIAAYKSALKKHLHGYHIYTIIKNSVADRDLYAASATAKLFLQKLQLLTAEFKNNDLLDREQQLVINNIAYKNFALDYYRFHIANFINPNLTANNSSGVEKELSEYLAESNQTNRAKILLATRKFASKNLPPSLIAALEQKSKLIYVLVNKKGVPSEGLTQQIKLIKRLDDELLQLQLQASVKESVLDYAKKTLLAKGDSSLYHLFTAFHQVYKALDEDLRDPVTLNAIFAPLRAAWSAILTESLAVINYNWQEEVYAFYQHNLVNTYPLYKSATTDAGFEAFDQFFRPDSGIFAKFYQHNLSAFINLDTGEQLPWLDMVLPVTSNYIDQLKILHKLTMNFYSNGSNFGFPLAIYPIPNQQLRKYSIAINGQQFIYANDPQEWHSLPFAQNLISTEIYNSIAIFKTNTSTPVIVSREGLWSLFKLLDAANSATEARHQLKFSWNFPEFLAKPLQLLIKAKALEYLYAEFPRDQFQLSYNIM